MFLIYFSLGLTIVANLFYHIFQKSISPNIHPLVSIIITYLIAILISLLLLPFFPLKVPLMQEIKNANWATYMLAFGLVGIEIGFLLMYRSGWNISIGSLITTTIVAVALIPVGIFIFKEGLSPLRTIGILLAITGIVLISWKK